MFKTRHFFQCKDRVTYLQKFLSQGVKCLHLTKFMSINCNAYDQWIKHQLCIIKELE